TSVGGFFEDAATRRIERREVDEPVPVAGLLESREGILGDERPVLRRVALARERVPAHVERTGRLYGAAALFLGGADRPAGVQRPALRVERPGRPRRGRGR